MPKKQSKSSHKEMGMTKFVASEASLLHDGVEDEEECVNRVTQVENRISQAEDIVACLQVTVKKLEKETETLCSKVDDLENRSRRSNLRLINLPYLKEQNEEMHALLWKVGSPKRLGPLRSPLDVERCHRLPSNNPEARH